MRIFLACVAEQRGDEALVLNYATAGLGAPVPGAGSGASAMTGARWEAAWREFWSDDEADDQGQPA